MSSTFLSNLHHAYAQTDGSYAFPNSREGDMLKTAKREIEQHLAGLQTLKDALSVAKSEDRYAYLNHSTSAQLALSARVEHLEDAMRYVTESKGAMATHLAQLYNADAEMLDWLERFLQIGGSSVQTSSTGEAHEDRPDDTEATRWNHPFSIGYQVEMENRGCYRWEELSNGARGLRQAIIAARAKHTAKMKANDPIA